MIQWRLCGFLTPWKAPRQHRAAPAGKVGPISDSLAAVHASHESVRRNESRAQEVTQETWALNRELARNHLAERIEAAMRRVHP